MAHSIKSEVDEWKLRRIRIIALGSLAIFLGSLKLWAQAGQGKDISWVTVVFVICALACTVIGLFHKQKVAE